MATDSTPSPITESEIDAFAAKLSQGLNSDASAAQIEEAPPGPQEAPETRFWRVHLDHDADVRLVQASDGRFYGNWANRDRRLIDTISDVDTDTAVSWLLRIQRAQDKGSEGRWRLSDLIVALRELQGPPSSWRGQ